MNPSFDSIITSPVHEFAGILSYISAGSTVCSNNQGSSQSEDRFVKIDRSPVNGKITELRVSKSLIKQLIYKGEPYPVCPNKVYHTLLLRDISVPVSESLLKGLYFESRCLGATASGEATMDLPRHARTGAKLSDHVRIDLAIERFKEVAREFGLVIDTTRTQVYKKRRWVDPHLLSPVPVYLDGTLDLASPITTPRYSFEMATLDLKLTRDRENGDPFSNGLFHAVPWGRPENMDFTEAVLYRLLFGLPFVYLVFDYKKEGAGFKDIPVITDIKDPDPRKASTALCRTKELTNTIRWVISSILRWERAGWPMDPLPLICNRCPILDCPRRTETIEV